MRLLFSGLLLLRIVPVILEATLKLPTAVALHYHKAVQTIVFVVFKHVSSVWCFAESKIVQY